MKVATFNDNSKIVGRELRFEGNQFIVEGIGEVGIDKLLLLDTSAALDWQPGMQAKIYEYFGKDLPSVVSGTVSDVLSSGSPVPGRKSGKPKHGKPSRRWLWITLGVLALAIALGGGYFLYSRSQAPAPLPPLSTPTTTTVVPTSSVVPTETVSTETVTPAPLVYSYDASQAVAAFNGYVTALKNKKYSAAYTHVYLPGTNDSTSSVAATPSVTQEDWSAANLAAGYTISASTLTTSALSKMPSKETSYGVVVTLKNVPKIVVKNSYQTTATPSLVLHWNSALNTYKIEDNDAFLRKTQINKPFTKQSIVGTSTVSTTIKVLSVLRSPSSIFVIWNYKDSGAFKQISTVLNAANTKATLFGTAVPKIKTIWQSKILSWMSTQTVNNNCVILTPKKFNFTQKGTISISIDMKRETSSTAPVMKFNF